LYAPGSGAPAGFGERMAAQLGSLLLAGHAESGDLVYLGDVGTGFTDAARRHLLQVMRLLQRADSPFPAEFARARG
jgi:bifunctional non-homologous end joining protein LigD